MYQQQPSCPVASARARTPTGAPVQDVREPFSTWAWTDGTSGLKSPAPVPAGAGDEASFLADTLLMSVPTEAPVGPGFEVILVPGSQAQQAVLHLVRLGCAVGAVFALQGRCGFFVPPYSGEGLCWPPGAAYLATGSQVELPPAHWSTRSWSGGTGWVRRHGDGQLFTAPLMLHLALAVVAAELAGSGR